MTDITVCAAYQNSVPGYFETSFPCFDEEYFEWIDLLEAVTGAEGEFTMIELGAGWGRWLVNAGVALRQYSGLPYQLVGVEAEPTHFRWMEQHVRTSGLDPQKVHLIEAAVDEQDGMIGFHITENPYGGPADWYGQAIGGSSQVRAVSLNTLLKPLKFVDLIDLDVQGAELKVLQASADELQRKVKRLHIATHSPEVETGLRDLFTRLGWTKLRDYSMTTVSKTDYGVIPFQDGIQTWLNPAFEKGSANKKIIANCLLDTVGFILELDPQWKHFYELLTNGVLNYAATDMISRIVRRGDVCVEINGNGPYFACLMAKFCGAGGNLVIANTPPEVGARIANSLAMNAFVQATFADGIEGIAARLEQTGKKHVRLLRCDFSGLQSVKEICPKLQQFLTKYPADFVLMSDVSASLAEQLASVFVTAGYQSRELDTCLPAYTRASAQDFLFSRPEVNDAVPHFSMAGSVGFVNTQYSQLENKYKFLEGAFETEQRQNKELTSKAAALQLKVDDLEHQPEPTKIAKPRKAGDAIISPAAALWNQREKLALMRPKIEQLYAAVASPAELSLFQWAQLTAMVLEFQPDLILELGRAVGNSAACFLEAIHELGPGQCRLLSVCLDPTWRLHTAQHLKKIVSDDWFHPASVAEENILTFDFQSALAGSRKCLVFWDAHGFEVAECVLGGLLPLLLPREHLVLMHDLSDLRYSSPDPSYGTNRLWMGKEEGESALWLDWVFSRVPQSISVLDFTTRNKIPLHSADESLHREIASDQVKAAALQASLGSEMGSLQSHWFWFSLNEAEQNISFPCFSPQASLERLQQRIALEAAPRSLSWRLLQRWWKLTNFLAPAGSMPRRVYNNCLRRLIQPSSR